MLLFCIFVSLFVFAFDANGQMQCCNSYDVCYGSGSSGCGWCDGVCNITCQPPDFCFCSGVCEAVSPPGTECPTPPSEPICSGSSDEYQYRCSTDECAANILQRARTCSRSNGSAQPIIEEIDGVDCIVGYGSCSGPLVIDCSAWSEPISIGNCGSWQKCGGGDWGSQIPSCACTGECLEKPVNSRLLDGENNEVSTNDATLPVKLDWDDVEHAQSYLVKVNGDAQENFLILGEPFLANYISESEAIPSSCSFQSGSTNSWSTIPCCSEDGTNCKPWEDVDEWEFEANLAPELVYPYDPDWTGENGAENTALPVTLDWCDVEEVMAYKFRAYLLKNGEEVCHPWMELVGTCEPVVLKKTLRPLPYSPGLNLYSDFLDEEKGYFTKDTEYLWEIATCIGEFAGECSDFSQKWKFNTAESTLPSTYLSWPPNDPLGKNPVGLPLVLDWNDKPGINSYWYEITPVGGSKKIEGNTQFSQAPSLNYGVGANDLSLKTLYSWRIWACWDYDAEKCEEDFLDEWYFKTTGQPPNLIYPTGGLSNTPIPVNFDWQDVGGAKSYVLKISGNSLTQEIIVDGKSEFSIDFPEYNIRQEKTYSWQVKTCPWKEGGGCNAAKYSTPQTFTTFRLPAPPESSPINGGQLSIDTKFISWEGVEGAKAYQHQIKYLSLSERETDETCLALAGKDLFETPKTVSNNSDYVELLCLGEYQWQARACLDENCQEVGKWSEPWTFSLVEPGEIGKGYGLIPCGQSRNNPATPWKETEACQIKHIFLMIKIIIDFLLLRLAPIVLVLLTLATGAMFYFSISTGGTSPIIRVKRLWKSAGIGLGMIFFAWTIVNIILKLAGYQIGIFGNWYQL